MKKWLYRIYVVAIVLCLFAAIMYEKLPAILFMSALLPGTLAILFVVYISARLNIAEWKGSSKIDRVKNLLLGIFCILGGSFMLYLIFPIYIGYVKYIFKKPTGKHVVPKTYYYDSEGDEHETYVTVYICTGPNSTKFHHDEYCKGLKNCSGEIEEILLEDAEIRDFEPCDYCYE